MMTEIDDVHNFSLEWGALLNIATRIADIEARIGPWDDLTNLVASLLDSSRSVSPQALAQDVYPFLFRLYFRIKPFSSPAPFNRVSHAKRDVPLPNNPKYHETQPGYLVSNYDYRIYLWAKRKGFADYIDNNSLWVPASSLTPAEAKRLETLLSSSS